MVVFEKCDPSVSTCWKEDEINEWLTFKYIITFTNEKRFVQHKFGKSRINANSDLHWNAIDPFFRTDFVMLITRMELDLQDNYWGFSKDDDSGFYIN